MGWQVEFKQLEELRKSKHAEHGGICWAAAHYWLHLKSNQIRGNKKRNAEERLDNIRKKLTKLVDLQADYENFEDESTEYLSDAGARELYLLSRTNLLSRAGLQLKVLDKNGYKQIKVNASEKDKNEFVNFLCEGDSYHRLSSYTSNGDKRYSHAVSIYRSPDVLTTQSYVFDPNTGEFNINKDGVKNYVKSLLEDSALIAIRFDNSLGASLSAATEIPKEPPEALKVP